MRDTPLLRFDVLSVAAWSPGLTTLEAWARWAEAPTPLRPDGVPDVPYVPANLRRRLDRRGKMALHTTFGVDPNADAGAYVFATPLGEVQRSAEILEALSQRQPISPATFAASVHNAIGAVYSIARGVHAPVVATSAGPDTAATAFIEALAAIAAEGEPGGSDAVVTYFDELLPPVYANCGLAACGPYAWSARVRRGPGTSQLSVVEPGAHPEPDDTGLRALRFLLGAVPTITTGMWLWSRHG